MANVQDVIGKLRDAIVQKSQSLLGSTKSAEYSDTCNEMETSEIEEPNVRPDHRPNKIVSSHKPKIAKLVNKYLTKLNGNSKRFLDNIYGVYKRGNLLMIGNSPIKFEGDFVQVNEQSYHLSVGLLQLLFKKLPDDSLINSEDIDSYRRIITVSSAHKKRYCVNEPIRKLKSKKFYNFIAPMFEKSSVKNDSPLSRVKEDNGNNDAVARKKRKMAKQKQTNAVVAKKIFEPIGNPLKKLVGSNTRVNSHLLTTTNETDNSYEADHSSEDSSDFSTNEYSPTSSCDNFISSRYQRGCKKASSDEEEEEEEEEVVDDDDDLTAYELDVWDDPNKLVDRLQVLVADQNMGIRTDYGEVYFILSELRNANIIY